MTKKQEIGKFLSTVEQATIAEIYENVSFGYFLNAHKHLGVLLAEMVKDGQIERVKKGIFRFLGGRRKKRLNLEPENKDQQSLF